MGLFSRKRSETRSEASFTPVDGEQLFVGEQSYQAALHVLLRGRGHKPEAFESCPAAVSESFVARLVPEPDNPYDPNAVAVHVDSRIVAYLSRGNAARYRRAFGTQHGEMPVALWVKPRAKGIVSVWPDDGVAPRA
jgi:hypothetical protein